jgi:hypothetical protein
MLMHLHIWLDAMPFYRYQFTVARSTPNVAQQLSTLMGPPASFWRLLSMRPGEIPKQPFVGTMHNDTFRITRRIAYRNSFLPRIHGTLTSVPEGTQITLRMTIHPLVGLFMLFWLAGVSYGALQISAGTAAGPGAFIPLVMLVFGIALTLLGFYPEAYKARRLLEQALATEWVNPAPPANF